MANLLNERLSDDNDIPKKKKPKKQKKKKAQVQGQIIKPISKNEILEKNKDEESLFDEKLESLTMEDFVKEQKQLSRSKRKYYFTKILMCFLCGYLLFLIYGVMVTTYDYDENGNVSAQIMSKKDIENQNE